MSWLLAAARVLESAVRGFFKDHCTLLAASLAFYVLFSGFPLLLLSVFVSRAVLDPEEAPGRLVQVIGEYVPLGEKLIENALRGAIEAGGSAAGISIVALLWSGTRIFAHTTRAMNDAWDVKHNYKMKTRLLIEVFLVALSVAVVSVTMLYKANAASLWSSLLSRSASPEEGWPNFIEEVAAKGAGFAIVLLFYRYMPRRRVQWRDALPGAVVATVLFQVSQEAFQAYISTFGSRYDEVYGSLASIAVVLFWAYITAAIFLFGAEISAAYCRGRGSEASGEEPVLTEKLANDAAVTSSESSRR